jgi:GT2 family glycosyltransferase
MTVAAVIPQWNRAALLRTLLGNLQQQTRRFDEVLVVDNGSSDESADVARNGHARLVSLPTNQGFAVAVNRGVDAVTADWVAILNNDVTLDPAWCERLLATAEKHNAAFATGKILMAQDPTRIDGTWDEISRGACAVRLGHGESDTPRWNAARPIRMASMTACLVRRNVFLRLGGLDERFESYLEDVDFGIRCAQAGEVGVYEPTAVAHHQGSATWGAWSSDTVRRLARNQRLLTTKHFAGQARWPIVAGQLLWGLVALRHGCGWAWLQGRLEALPFGAEVSGDSGDAVAFAGWLRESEREILARDASLYWRLYRWLTSQS